MGGAYKAYWRAYRRLDKALVTEVEAERRLSLERLDDLIAAHYPWAIGQTGCLSCGLPPQPPSVESAAIVFKAEERRSKLLGLDARPKVPHEHGESVERRHDVAFLESKVARLAASLTAAPIPLQPEASGNAVYREESDTLSLFRKP